MKPLATNHRVLIWICACPAEKGASKWTKRTYCVFALMVFLFVFGSFALSSLFLYKFLVSDSSGFYALFQAAGAFTAIYLHICAVLNQHKIVTLFTNLTEIYDTCEIQTDLRTVSMSPVICQCHCAIGPYGSMARSLAICSNCTFFFSFFNRIQIGMWIHLNFLNALIIDVNTFGSCISSMRWADSLSTQSLIYSHQL